MSDRVDLPPLAPEDFTCSSCALAYEEIEPSSVAERTREVIRDLHRVVTAATDGALRQRPDAGGWSPLEYLCHVRDVYVAFTIRLYRARTEREPRLEPVYNDLRTVRFRHNQANPSAVLAELDLIVAGFADELARTTDWDRTVTRLPTERRTARWLARQALHEGRHHLGDIEAGLAAH